VPKEIQEVIIRRLEEQEGLIKTLHKIKSQKNQAMEKFLDSVFKE
jgi:hypothetical protein